MCLNGKVLVFNRFIYNRDFIFILCPKKYKNIPLIECDDIIYYKNYKDTLLQDYRFKLVYNFTPFHKINSHYLKMSAFEIITIEKLKKLSHLENFNILNLLNLILSII